VRQHLPVSCHGCDGTTATFGAVQHFIRLRPSLQPRGGQAPRCLAALKQHGDTHADNALVGHRSAPRTL
jgi:hypothetical protein